MAYKILVCPLNWGLGHATRIIPIVYRLKANGHELYLGGNGQALSILKDEFPDLPVFTIPGHNIKYSKSNTQLLRLLRFIPGFVFSIIGEHKIVKKLTNRYTFDIIISDNRYGLYNNKAYCIFVTHQLMLKLPMPFKWCEGIIHHINLWFINKYNECWIPDIEGNNNFSGDLSHRYSLPSNAIFIGPLTRFSQISSKTNLSAYDILIIISGPEKQRSVFENIILDQIKFCNEKILLIRGLPNEEREIDFTNKKVKIINHLGSSELAQAIQQSGLVICRSGYTSLMDLLYFNKPLIMVPTPGQTEQEYLALWNRNRDSLLFYTQKEFSLDKAIKDACKLNVSKTENDTEFYKLFENKIDNLQINKSELL